MAVLFIQLPNLLPWYNKSNNMFLVSRILCAAFIFGCIRFSILTLCFQTCEFPIAEHWKANHALNLLYYIWLMHREKQGVIL